MKDNNENLNKIDNIIKQENLNKIDNINKELYKNSCTIDINYENITIKNNNFNNKEDMIKSKDNNNFNDKQDYINKNQNNKNKHNEGEYEIIPLYNKERLKEKYNENKLKLQKGINEIIYNTCIIKFNKGLEYNEEKGSYSWKKLTKDEKKQLKTILEKDKKYVILNKLSDIF